MIDIETFALRGVSMTPARYLGRDAVLVRMAEADWQDPTREALADRDFMAWLPTDFHDGTIAVDVASELAPRAPGYARGFIGLAFRIEAQGGRFESIYLRPTNAMADDQVRRNRSVQYVGFPEHRFDRLRAEEPGRYETYAAIATGRWIAMRVVVAGGRAELYLDGAVQPALLVTDLKHGPDVRGGIGLWLESGTLGYFSNLKVERRD